MVENKMISDGGPAFPTLPISSGDPKKYAGMSLRDWFAGKALQGMLASDSSVDRTAVNKRVWAGVAYAFADAMLEVRKK